MEIEVREEFFGTKFVMKKNNSSAVYKCRLGFGPGVCFGDLGGLREFSSSDHTG